MPEELNVDVILRRPREARASKDVAEAPRPVALRGSFHSHLRVTEEAHSFRH